MKMKTNCEFELDTSMELETIAYEGSLRLEFSDAHGSLAVYMTEELVQKMSAVFASALTELRYVRENPRYDHRLVVVPDAEPETSRVLAGRG